MIQLSTKNLTGILIFSLILSLALSGCLSDEPTDKNHISTENIDLEQIYLTKQDFPANYTLLNENLSTKPSVQINQTGNNITWHIQQRYDATYYDLNSTNGIMQSILELDTADNARNLTLFSKENLLSYDYQEKNIKKIGDETSFLYQSYNSSNVTYTYYTLLFSFDTLFVAIGGSAENETAFIDYATTIEQRINDTASIN